MGFRFDRDPTYDGFTIKAKGDAMAYTLPVDKQVHVQVTYVDAGGNPAASMT